MKIFALSIVILVFTISTSYADTLGEKMQSLGFIENAPPAKDTPEWKILSGQRAFIVSTKNGISIRLAERSDLSRPETKFNTGKIEYIGTDHGEFGGQLFTKDWISTEPLLSGNVKSMIPVGHDLYVFTGMTHMIFDRGSVHVVRNYHKPSTPGRITLLPSAPAAVMLDEDQYKPVFVIVGQNSFMILEPDDGLQVIAHNTFWMLRFPSSLIRFEDYYVFGIRGGVVAVSATLFGKTDIRYFEPEQ
ncbi:MAG: hypothetical protein SynsKO_21390 [Synoicihabitans sp.]